MSREKMTIKMNGTNVSNIHRTVNLATGLRLVKKITTVRKIGKLYQIKQDDIDLVIDEDIYIELRMKDE